MRYLLILLTLLSLAGCSSKPAMINSNINHELSFSKCPKRIVIAPVILICTTERGGDDKTPPIYQQEKMQTVINLHLKQLLMEKGFEILDNDTKTKKLLAALARKHNSLILQYHSKETFKPLLADISTSSGAEGIIILQISSKYGSGAAYNLLDGTVRPETSYTSFKLACISTIDANHKWYREVYVRKPLIEKEIENLLQLLILNSN